MGTGARSTAGDTTGEQDAFAIPTGVWHEEVALDGGVRLLLRQIRPADRDRLVAGLRRLSPESRHLRFHADIEELTARQLDYLTDVDHVDHEAIVALDPDRPEVPGVGVARYIRDPYERHVAEAAVTVADEYHSRGVGTLLIGALARRASAQGVGVFRNYVLASNTAMLGVFDNLGATRELERPGLWRVDLPVPRRRADLPNSPAGRVFHASAAGRFRLFSLLPPVLGGWPRRRPLSGPGAGSIEFDVSAELLDRWLADRDSRAPTWPAGG